MTFKPFTVEAIQIHGAPALDPIEVFWRNYEPGIGSVTITCYGAAWTAYFGGMSGQTIQQFFGAASADYLVNKLINRQWHKCTKAHEGYIGRIVKAVKDHLELAEGE